jgi:putative ABC transport system permease protein
MLRLIFRNLLRRPLRNGLTLAGISVAMGVLICVESFGDGYRNRLRREVEQAGVQIMLVPLGCPYDAAARVLKNNALEASLPFAALESVRNDPGVAVAAPMLIAALPRQNERRVDIWVGLDESSLQLRPWWNVTSGRAWFAGSNEVILGADAAAIEMRAHNDKLSSPETKRTFRVAGILERSGTSDDSAFFVPLATAQEMFGQTGRLTAIAIRLKDPTHTTETVARLQEIRGAQAVTMTEMMGTFARLVGMVRTWVLSIVAIVVTVSALTVFNTLLAGVLERANEFGLMRAMGASRTQVFSLLVGEALLLTIAGLGAGIVLAIVLGPHIETVARIWTPFSSAESLLAISASAVLRGCPAVVCAGALAAVYPAWLAARMRPAMGAKSQ